MTKDLLRSLTVLLLFTVPCILGIASCKKLDQKSQLSVLTKPQKTRVSNLVRNAYAIWSVSQLITQSASNGGSYGNVVPDLTLEEFPRFNPLAPESNSIRNAFSGCQSFSSGTLPYGSEFDVWMPVDAFSGVDRRASLGGPACPYSFTFDYANESRLGNTQTSNFEIEFKEQTPGSFGTINDIETFDANLGLHSTFNADDEVESVLVNGTGTIESKSDGKVDLKITGRGDMRELQDLFNRWIEVNVSISLTFSDFNAVLNVRTTGLDDYGDHLFAFELNGEPYTNDELSKLLREGIIVK